MRDEQPIPDPDDEARIDWLVLDLLIGKDEQRPWSIEEIVREHGHRQNALDALNRLEGAGLIHRTKDGFVSASRATIRYTEIAG